MPQYQYMYVLRGIKISMAILDSRFIQFENIIAVLGGFADGITALH